MPQMISPSPSLAVIEISYVNDLPFGLSPSSVPESLKLCHIGPTRWVFVSLKDLYCIYLREHVHDRHNTQCFPALHGTHFLLPLPLRPSIDSQSGTL